MSQQERKEKEGNVVRRMTWSAGAAALGLSGLFTTAAATGVPMVFASDSNGRQANAETDDVYVIRQVHVQVQPIQASTGGVRSAGGSAGGSATRTSGGTATGGGTAAGGSTAAGGASAAASGGTTVTSVTTTTKTVTSTPAPAPAAATGGTAPRV